MGIFHSLLRSEWTKLRRSGIWLLAPVSPLLCILLGFGAVAEGEPGLDWQLILSYMFFLHAVLFLPLLAGVYAAFVCRYEHDNGGWKQLLALPVSRESVYVVKFLSVAALLAVTQLLFVAGVLAVGFGGGLPGAVPWRMIVQVGVGGFLASLPLAALQLAVSVGWASFAAPLAINVILTIPNVLIVQSSKYGPYYPWAQPFLASMPDWKFPLIVGAGFVVFFLSGFVYFRRLEI
ncbi:MAG: rane protein [Paenibacillaceae bacterium]|jgi:hypothetical protein|nr:rane protein [Paenibacillaceae bacterium]